MFKDNFHVHYNYCFSIYFNIFLQSIIFKTNCYDYCLIGNDNIDDKDDYYLKCDTNAFLERENVCAFYKDQFDTFSNKSKAEMSGYFPPDRKGTATMGLYGWIDTKSLEDNMKTVCPWSL